MKELQFTDRHIGPDAKAVQLMLQSMNLDSVNDLIEKALPNEIRMSSEFKLSKFSKALDESKAISYFREKADKIECRKSYIGCGYYGTNTPAIILRNILENPCWYTQYTPYQPEISQGRLEALLNYQTLICSLTGMDVANASLLDEATAAAEAMYLCYNHKAKDTANAKKIFIAKNVFPQTIAVVNTRARALGLQLVVDSPENAKLDESYFAVLLQYPDANGDIIDYSNFIAKAKEKKILCILAADIMALTLLKSSAEMGADIAVGSTQRFGVPMGFGGPHAAYFAVKDELKRTMPGRLVGVSKDRLGNNAYRLSLQTREQHIRREKATSNICTAQVLLAIMASFYAVYHGPKNLQAIANRIAGNTSALRKFLTEKGFKFANQNSFDTLTIIASAADIQNIKLRSEEKKINLGFWNGDKVTISLDETSTTEDLQVLAYVLTGSTGTVKPGAAELPANMLRKDNILTEDVFNRYHSETECLRYIKRLESKDLSLANSMIPLGSCTMKLNATTEMIPITWPEFASIHPFAPKEQVVGYLSMIKDLEDALADVTGFDAVSLQPNAGSQGEYAGLLSIRGYHEHNGQGNRNICLIPVSAHGTNPATATLAGMKVVAVACDSEGNVDIENLKLKAAEHKDNLACLMITYPSTHGVFESTIKEATAIIHSFGGQVYMDGANLNALVGFAKPAELGADVMHINLHKTFCIPHGGGGPGVGPIGVKKHLTNFLPSHPLWMNNDGYGPVSAAPYGSAAILPIPTAYIAMMGSEGLKNATAIAILNANYIANKLKNYYPVLYTGKNGFVAHECILDLRGLKKECGVEVDDVAKRLMDYGIHAPTVSWPVAGTIMVEPTESESKEELDRFIEAMENIYKEAQKIKSGEYDPQDNPLKGAPHTAVEISSDEWTHKYGRSEAAFPVPGLKRYKFWPASARIDAAYGDRNLICTCGSVEDY